jgi:lysophospholipase L1-like esterase
MMMPSMRLLILAGSLLAAPLAAQEHRLAEHWVSTLATAQDLTPPPDLKLPPPPPAVLESFKTAPQRIVPFPSSIADETVRMIVQPTVGASELRVQLSNAQGKPPLTISAAHIAIRTGGASIDPSSDRTLTFGRKGSIYIPPGAIVVSDPVTLPVRPNQELAVSLYVHGDSGGVTTHALGLNPTYIAKGDQSAAATLTDAKAVRTYYWLTGLDAALPAPAGTIVAYGDSITDGFATTPGAHHTWPEILAQRLRARDGAQRWGVINMGISGNRVLRDGAGASAVARFDRDVLSRPGVRWVVMLEGINDINMSQMKGLPDDQRASAQDIIAGLQTIIDKAHLHGLKIMGATITPTGGLWLYTPASEASRQTINQWIRTSGAFDAVADFDKATRDPHEPSRLRPEFDSGDHVHPNDAGTKAMAESIDLAHFNR